MDQLFIEILFLCLFVYVSIYASYLLIPSLILTKLSPVVLRVYTAHVKQF